MRTNQKESLDFREVQGTLIAAARAECQRCRGREFGDCGDGCRWFAMTATDADLNAASHSVGSCRKLIIWTGPVRVSPKHQTVEE